ncbi:ADP-ribosylation factor GTPase-activating protein AGD3-like protein [Tanacetum coccineum]
MCSHHLHGKPLQTTIFFAPLPSTLKTTIFAGNHNHLLRHSLEIEHTLSDRLLCFGNVELQDIKEARKRFDKADAVYSLVAIDFCIYVKSTRIEIASATEEELYSARMHFEQARFSLIDDPLTNESLDGCSLLHVACQTADCSMVELLLQHGSNINASDSKGQTPLHHSIIRGRLAIAKLLLNK